MPRNLDWPAPLTKVMMRWRLLPAFLLCVTACSSSTTTPIAATSHHPSPSPSANAVPATQMCFTRPPSDWSDAMSTLIASLDGINFGMGAVDDKDGLVFGGVFGASRSYIAAVNLASGKLTEIAPVQLQGFGWMSFADGWLAWPQFGLGGSSIQLWNSQTHERRQIVTSGPSDAAIGDGEVAWTEGAGGDNQTSALRVYQFATGKISSLDSGKLETPVFAGHYLVWTKAPATAPDATFDAALVFADAATLQPMAAPPELSAVRGVANLAGSPDRLVWTSQAGSSAWLVDDLPVGIVRTYQSHGHDLQFPQLADPYLAWAGTAGDSMIDLRSGVGFDLPYLGRIEAGGDTVVVDSGVHLKGQDRTDIAVLHPSQLSPLGPCVT